MEEKNTVPQQQQGSESNTEDAVTLANESEAKAFYEVVKQRLLQVNGWQQLAGKATAHFQLTDEKGNAVSAGVYFLRIQSPNFNETRKLSVLK